MYTHATPTIHTHVHQCHTDQSHTCTLVCLCFIQTDHAITHSRRRERLCTSHQLDHDGPMYQDTPSITNYMCFFFGLPPLLTLPFWWQALHDGPFDALIFPSAPGTKSVLGSARVQVLHVIGRPLLSPTLTFSPFLFGANFTLDALSVTQSTCTGAIAEIRASRPACRWSITETASAAALETTRDSNGQLSMVDEYIEQCIDRARTVHIEFLPTYLSTSLSAYLLTSCQPSLDNIFAYLPACVPTHIPTYVHTHVLHQPA